MTALISEIAEYVHIHRYVCQQYASDPTTTIKPPNPKTISSVGLVRLEGRGEQRCKVRMNATVLFEKVEQAEKRSERASDRQAVAPDAG
jgi:3-phenylpropionate/cinnamic acid dioxygenase small subunit